MKNQLNKGKKETGANRKAQNENKLKGKEERFSFINNNQSPGNSFIGFDLGKTAILPETKLNKKLPEDLQLKMESAFNTDFSTVSIYKESQKALNLNALAFTQGENVHFAPGQFNPGSETGRNLIGHEFAHVMQQRRGAVKSTSVLGKGLNLNNDRGLENEADDFGKKAVLGESIANYKSPSLGIRNTRRYPVQAKTNVIQRNIKDSKELARGKMELDFTKNDATAKGAKADETGTIKFTPNKTAPNSNKIRLIQIVRTTDTTGAKEKDYTWTGAEADRNKVMTSRNNEKNIAPGFFVDHSAAAASPRTKKSDATVSPYYRDYWPNVGNSQDGHKKSKADIQHASLWDRPGDSAPGRFIFVTSAKAEDTGTYYGTALWGFEIYSDKGTAKIKNEYSKFREYRGETFDAALEKFNEFYKNPGTSGAPTK